MTSEPTKPTLTTAIDNLKASLRPVLPKRFYKAATAVPRDGGYAVLLDGRAVRTPAKKPLVVPTGTLAQALAAEWEAQATFIDPARMPLTRIVNSALDGVTGREAEVAAEIVKYAGSDLLLYRAEAPEKLVLRQANSWDPVLAWATGAFGGPFTVESGLMPVTQPDATLSAVAARVSRFETLQLAALHVVTTLTGSALLALAHADGRLSAQETWTAANVDEDHQIELWGEDDEASARRAGRWSEMLAASTILRG